MEKVFFKAVVQNKRIEEICTHILDEPIDSVNRICERYGINEDEVRKYDVYSVNYHSGKKILKKAGVYEVENYEKYLGGGILNTPRFYGKYDDTEGTWILLENIGENDLRTMNDQLAVLSAVTISEIQNAFWGCADSERFEAYLQRINRRYDFIKNEDLIGAAYQVFLDRQKTCPRTLSNGDFLQSNAMLKNNKVYVIDWGFGGILPYALDIARFIAHATEQRETFPFYMNDHQKDLFLENVYQNLRQKPDEQRFKMDIELALLNEYVEFIEADEDDSHWYLNHARNLAKQIMYKTV